jgi:hypothetical protein
MLEPLVSGGTTPEFFADGHFHENCMLVNIHNGLQTTDVMDMLGDAHVIPSVNREELIHKIVYKLKGKEPSHIQLYAHTDGILIFKAGQLNEEKYLLECKAVKSEKYYKVKAGEMDKEWYGQIQTYLQILNKSVGIETGYLIVKNRETGIISPPIRVDLDSSYLKERRDALVQIHRAMSNKKLVDREYENRKNAECKWCSFGTENGNGECWKTKE